MTLTLSTSDDDSVDLWDPRLPVLAGVLARMEELDAPLVRFESGQVTYQLGTDLLFNDPMPTVPVKEPFPLHALLDEQIPAEEQMLAALRGVPSEHGAMIRTARSGLIRNVEPVMREVMLRIQMDWVAQTLYIHMPILVGDVTAD